MPEEKEKQKDSTRGLEPKDVSKLIEQNVSILHEIDRSLQGMRNDLTSIMTRVVPSPVPGLYGQPIPTQLLGLEALGGGSVVPPFGGALGFGPMGLPAYSNPEAAGAQSRSLGGGYWGGAGPAGGTPSGTGDGRTFRLTRDLKTLPPTIRAPSVDVIDDGNEFIVKVELPGVKKEDLDLLCFERTLTVSAKARIDIDEGSVLLAERGSIEYRRTIPLPTEVQSGQTKATLKDGVLTLRVPKKVPGEAPRRIDVAYT